MNTHQSRKRSATLRSIATTVYFSAIFIALAICGTPQLLDADTSRNYISASCMEVLGKFSPQGPPSDLLKNEFLRDYKGKWVKWTGTVLRNNETLWGIDVIVKCLRETPSQDVTISFDISLKSRLLNLTAGRPIQFTGQIEDYGEMGGISIKNGELGLKDAERESDGIQHIQPAQERLAVSVPVREGSSGQPSGISKTWREPTTGIELVWVPGGCFQMGCGYWSGECYADEKPAHEVCLGGFWIGRFEVTQGQWRQVMGFNPSGFQSEASAKHPVEMVSWEEAHEFIRKLTTLTGGRHSFRLPTEAEWENACRSGGKPETYSGGHDIESVGWYESNSSGTTHPVDTKQPNGLGVYNMSGNVREWCEDVYSKNAYGSQRRNDPVNMRGGSEHVVRGGCWYYGSKVTRCGNRYSYPASRRRNDLGFRLVREP